MCNLGAVMPGGGGQGWFKLFMQIPEFRKLGWEQQQESSFLSSWLLGYLKSPCQGGSREQKPLRWRLMLPSQQSLLKRCGVQEWHVSQQLLYACCQAAWAPGTPTWTWLVSDCRKAALVKGSRHVNRAQWWRHAEEVSSKKGRLDPSL